MEELLEILEEMKPGVDFKSEKHLIDDKVFDSLRSWRWWQNSATNLMWRLPR